MRTLVWFRGKDLRVADHLPLLDAAQDGGDVIPLFVADPYFFAPERAAELPHRMQFLTDSLAELANAIEALGSRLVVVGGKSVDVVPKIAELLKVERVVAYRWTEPVGRERDKRVAKGLGAIPFDLYEGETLAAPGQVLTGKGQPFSVFGPFARAFAKVITVEKPKRAPKKLPPLPTLPKAIQCIRIPGTKELAITRNDGLVKGGEDAANKRLKAFIRGAGKNYEVGRNLMGEPDTSRLSQDLKFGTLSARTVYNACDEGLIEHPKARRIYLNELVWRELAYHVLWHRPSVLDTPFRETWKKFPFERNKKAWEAWVTGKTGYPVVDASARQLLATGFVHNRARMISASFLTKHLLIDFRDGEAHYMKWLTDGDWASNDLGWQWSTGCGVDAQPWFRVFNPTLQGERFDPEGKYVREWLPELRDVPTKLVHRPWDHSGKLAYPGPIIDHDFARKRFLATAKSHLG